MKTTKMQSRPWMSNQLFEIDPIYLEGTGTVYKK